MKIDSKLLSFYCKNEELSKTEFSQKPLTYMYTCNTHVIITCNTHDDDEFYQNKTYGSC